MLVVSYFGSLMTSSPSVSANGEPDFVSLVFEVLRLASAILTRVVGFAHAALRS